MPTPKQQSKKKLHQNNRGQFLILSAVSIVIIMISFASLLAYTSVSRISLTRTDFREVTAEANLNFRRALGAAIAEVSKSLDLEASISGYLNYTSLDEYPEARSGGYEFISDWQKAILQKYAGLGLNLSLSQPSFQCNWSSNPGYSMASSNASLDILAYDFYGWESEANVQLNVTILDLEENGTDGNGKIIAFYFSVLMENGVPVTNIQEDAISVLFQLAEGEIFRRSSANLTYFGNGRYLAEFYTDSPTVRTVRIALQDPRGIVAGAVCNVDPQGGGGPTYDDTGPVTRNLSVSPNPTQGASSVTLIGWVDDTTTGMRNIADAEYFVDTTGGNGTGTRLQASDGSFNSPVERVQARINMSGWSLGNHTIYVHGMDSAGNWGNFNSTTLAVTGRDSTGPVTRNLSVSPNPTNGTSSVTLTGWVDDTTTGMSNIAEAEYFVDTTGRSGRGTRLQASDGSFNSPVEAVKATISISSWSPGNHTIYVHGRDSSGNWGNFNSTTLTVTLKEMYVLSIDFNVRQYGPPFWRFYRVEAVVTIVDIDENPVQGAIVYGHWNNDRARSESDTTGPDGKASFWSDPGRAGTRFTFTVDYVSKAGYTYNPALNKETSKSITV